MSPNIGMYFFWEKPKIKTPNRVNKSLNQII